MKCPCQGCNDRKMNCHAGCDKYKTWRNEYDEYARTIAKKQRADLCVVAEKRSVIYNAKKRKYY